MLITNRSCMAVHFRHVCARGHLDLVPVDIDVSPLDTPVAQQGVSFHLQKALWLRAEFAYVGAEGYMLDHELRPGKQHRQERALTKISPGGCVE